MNFPLDLPFVVNHSNNVSCNKTNSFHDLKSQIESMYPLLHTVICSSVIYWHHVKKKCTSHYVLTPQTSTILYCRNNQDTIVAKLNEIASSSGELIVVDNGSSDMTLKHVSKFIESNCPGARLLHYPNLSRRDALLHALTFLKQPRVRLLTSNNVVSKKPMQDLRKFLRKRTHQICNVYDTNSLRNRLQYGIFHFKKLVKKRGKTVVVKHGLSHVGFILDGNRRYTAKIGGIKKFQHLIGLYKTYELLYLCKKHNIFHVSLYAFAEKNWRRSEDEKNNIFCLLEKLVAQYRTNPFFEDIKINVLSTDAKQFSKRTREVIQEIEEISATKNNKMVCNFMLSYSGQMDVINAFNKVIKLGLPFTKSTFEKHLLTHNSPPPDLVIRFGGHQRLSDFMVYQSAYTELLFVDKLLPEFVPLDFEKIIENYSNRVRNFGK
jgi:undecaprenyl diphosphate synthase